MERVSDLDIDGVILREKNIINSWDFDHTTIKGYTDQLGENIASTVREAEVCISALTELREMRKVLAGREDALRKDKHLEYHVGADAFGTFYASPLSALAALVERGEA